MFKKNKRNKDVFVDLFEYSVQMAYSFAYPVVLLSTDSLYTQIQINSKFETIMIKLHQPYLKANLQY